MVWPAELYSISGMKIGLLSDSHGNISATGKAAVIFREAGVGAVFHCGDLGSADVLAELAVLEVPVHVVLGNVDRYSNDWKYFPTNLGVQMHGRFGDVELEGKRIALLHSDDSPRFHQAILSGDYDLVLSGHSHEVHDHMEGRTRCINPGAVANGRPDTSCAVFDLKSGELMVFEI